MQGCLEKGVGLGLKGEGGGEGEGRDDCVWVCKVWVGVGAGRL